MSDQDEFEATGRIWHRKAVPEPDLLLLDEAFGLETRPGQRLAATDRSREALATRAFQKSIQRIVPKAIPVRVVAFAKGNNANWSIPWHQDRALAVQGRADVPGFTNWMRKLGVWHCEPPKGILARMLFVRLHLNPCDGANGAMEHALGGHRRWLVRARDADGVGKRSVPRRVLRIDCADFDLPAPRKWAGL